MCLEKVLHVLMLSIFFFFSDCDGSKSNEPVKNILIRNEESFEFGHGEMS